MADTLKNFAISAVATAPSPADSGTSLVVTAGHGSRFPSGDIYLTVCPANTLPTPANAEVVRGSFSTDTLTMTRAQDGTSARTILVGDQIFQCVNKALFEQFLALSGGTMTGVLLIPNGSAGAPSIGFAGDATSGLFSHGGVNAIGLTAGGNEKFRITTGNELYVFAPIFQFYSAAATLAFGAPEDIRLRRTGVGILEIANATDPQSLLHYSRDAGASNRNYLHVAHAVATLSGVSGATVTATGLIPDGAIVLGITSRVTTALGVSGGTTGYQVGDGSDADRWGNVTGTAAGTKTTNADWTTTTIPLFNAAQNVVITANGGNFDGTGVIFLDVSYAMGLAD